MSNTELWDKLGKTDPAHTKSFRRSGGFSGTAIKPMWAYRRMTEEFGPCGKGWGVNAPSFEVVNGPEGEVLVYCTASIWYEEQSQVAFGVGGDKAVGKNKNGLNSDDEAFKKAFTDAITNALKMIGIGADVHMGLFDDNKYVNTMRDEYSEKDKPPPADQKSKRLSKDQARELFERLQTALRNCATAADYDAFWQHEKTVTARKSLPEDWERELIKMAGEHIDGLGEKAA